MATFKHKNSYLAMETQNYDKRLIIENVLIIIFGVLMLICDLSFNDLIPLTFTIPIMNIFIGIAGLIYTKFNEDTQLTIFLISIFVGITVNFVLFMFLSLVIFLSIFGFFNRNCPHDETESCRNNDIDLIMMNLALIVIILFSLGVISLILVVHFDLNESEEIRKGDHFEKIKI